MAKRKETCGYNLLEDQMSNMLKKANPMNEALRLIKE